MKCTHAMLLPSISLCVYLNTSMSVCVLTLALYLLTVQWVKKLRSKESGRWKSQDCRESDEVKKWRREGVTSVKEGKCEELRWESTGARMRWGLMLFTVGNHKLLREQEINLWEKNSKIQLGFEPKTFGILIRPSTTEPFRPVAEEQKTSYISRIA